MEKFQLFWIEQDVAHYFYHKGEILYRFLLEYRHSNNSHTTIQYEYVTNKIPHNDLITYILKKSRTKNIDVRQKDNILKLTNGKSMVQLKINDKSIDIYAQTLLCAENIIFPILRNLQSSFFIIAEENDEYGWIAPFRKRNEKNLNESLYSLL